MKSIMDWVKQLPKEEHAKEADGGTTEDGNKPMGPIALIGTALLSILASTLLSGTLVFCIASFGAGSGLPRVEFKGALAFALLGSWFSMGSSGYGERSPQEFPKYLAHTLVHQCECALLMLLLLGILFMGFGSGGR